MFATSVFFQSRDAAEFFKQSVINENMTTHGATDSSGKIQKQK